MTGDDFSPSVHRIVDEGCGLRAFVVVDDTSLGPAAGGIRTRGYADEAAALDDARRLARAMTFKCALAGLDAGGGKGVVMLGPGIRRGAAFERLGELVDSLGGRFLTAGDLGTTVADLQAIARRTAHVCTDEAGLADAVGRGCVRAMLGCIDVLEEEGRDDLAGLRVAVQGCGKVGAAVARAAHDAGAEVVVADLDADLAARIAAPLGAPVLAADAICGAEVDILAPCAVGGTIDAAVAAGLRARAVCGAANNILAAPAAEQELGRRGILFVPDPLASAGAVIEGVGRMLMGLADPGDLIDALRASTRRVLRESRRRGVPATAVAEAHALARIRAARQHRVRHLRRW